MSLDSGSGVRQAGTANEVERAAARATWAARPRNIPGASPKTADWLSLNEVAALLGVTRFQSSMMNCWNGLVGAASAGAVPSVRGASVQMRGCTIRGVDRWCIHKSGIEALEKEVQPPKPVWPTRPSGWSTMAEAVEKLANEADAQAFEDGWRLLASGHGPDHPHLHRVLDTRFVRHQLYAAQERVFIHDDDIAPLAAAVRGRVPHLRRPYMAPRSVLAKLEPDSRPIGGLLLKSYESAKTASEAGIDVRIFSVEGQAVPCLHSSSLPRFVAAVRELHDVQLRREIEALEDSDARDGANDFAF
jgi:hypothetical protein